MAKCPKCSRDLPLSGRCPFCDKTAQGGFSLKNFAAKGPGDPAPAKPAPVVPSAMDQAPPVTAAPMQTLPSLDDIAPPTPPSTVPPAPPSPPPMPTAAVKPASGSILESLRGRPAPATSTVATPATPPPLDIAAAPTMAVPVPPPASPTPSVPPKTTTQSEIPILSQMKAKNETERKAVLEAPLKDDTPATTSVYSSPLTGFGDEEMECSVLAGILADQYTLESSLSKGLMVDLFSTKYSRALAKAVLTLREENREGSVIDKIILKNKLRAQGMYDTPMQNFLNRVAAMPAPTLDQVLHYMELLKEGALKRKLKEIANRIVEYIEVPADNKPGLENFSTAIVRDIREVQKAKTSKRINLVKEEMREIIKDMDRREIEGETEIIGYSFEPFHYLNIALSGFRKGFLYAIAGAPRRGKTTFTLELATSVATNCKIPVLFFTYEQTKKNLTYRLLAKESRVNPDTLQRKKIRSDDIAQAKFMGGWKKMQNYMDYFYIIEATKVDTVDRIRTYAYNVMQDFNTENIMIFVDYIQKMPLSRQYMDEKFKVEEISTELKGLTIELNNPIMVISSLNKEGCLIDGTDSPERPTMYHCKGSGDLEYDLDAAMIQAKDWGDTKELYAQLQQKAEELGKDPTRVPKVEVVNLYLDKNRDAPEGIYSIMQYLFFIEDNKFVEMGPKYEDDRYRYSKIEQLVQSLIDQNYIVFYDRERDMQMQKGRVQIKLKSV